MVAKDEKREKFTINLSRADAWGIQMCMKFNNVMLSPVDGHPIFPVGIIPFLRVKVNHALLRFAGEPALSEVTIPISYEECWCIDWMINVQSWKGSDDLLNQVFAAMAEYEMGGLHLRAVGDAGDALWDRETEAKFGEWAAKQYPESGPGAGAGTPV